MITVVPGPLIVEPQVWTLVFGHVARTRVIGWLAFGRLKHVRAFTYVPYMHVWLFYDVHLTGTTFVVAADGAHQHMIKAWMTGGASVLRMRRVGPSPRVSFRFGFWCVPAMKHLLGLRCGALRPDALWRHCVANGGEVVEDLDGRAGRIGAVAVWRGIKSVCAGAFARGPRPACGAVGQPRSERQSRRAA